jgi:hypothetical protein
LLPLRSPFCDPTVATLRARNAQFATSHPIVPATVVRKPGRNPWWRSLQELANLRFPSDSSRKPLSAMSSYGWTEPRGRQKSTVEALNHREMSLYFRVEPGVFPR